jgi:hypothetical protein
MNPRMFYPESVYLSNDGYMGVAACGNMEVHGRIHSGPIRPADEYYIPRGHGQNPHLIYHGPIHVVPPYCPGRMAENLAPIHHPIPPPPGCHDHGLQRNPRSRDSYPGAFRPRAENRRQPIQARNSQPGEALDYETALTLERDILHQRDAPALIRRQEQQNQVRQRAPEALQFGSGPLPPVGYEEYEEDLIVRMHQVELAKENAKRQWFVS